MPTGPEMPAPASVLGPEMSDGPEAKLSRPA
jgi:hypothetical protein